MGGFCSYAENIAFSQLSSAAEVKIKWPDAYGLLSGIPGRRFDYRSTSYFPQKSVGQNLKRHISLNTKCHIPRALSRRQVSRYRCLEELREFGRDDASHFFACLAPPPGLSRAGSSAI